MMSLLNAAERTMNDFIDLGNKSGWQLERVHLEPGGAMSQLIFSLA
jgi:hypothetical protein